MVDHLAVGKFRPIAVSTQKEFKMTLVQQLQNIIRLFIWSASFFVLTAQAQSNSPETQERASADWTAGEIRKLDKAAGKLTIRHEDIKNLNMPAMTMVFTAKDKTMLEAFNIGDKILFMVVQEQGKLILTDVKPN